MVEGSRLLERFESDERPRIRVPNAMFSFVNKMGAGDTGNILFIGRISSERKEGDKISKRVSVMDIKLGKRV